MSARRTYAAAMDRRSSRAVLVAVGLTAVVPFLQPVPPVDPYTMRFAGILLAACAWLWAWLLDPAMFRVHRGLLIAAGLVGALTVVSALVSVSPGVELTFGAEGGLMAAPSWLALLVVFLLSGSLKPTARVVSVLRLVFVWGVVSAAMVIWERASSASQVTGGFGNANYAGAALVTMLPLALFYANAEAEPRLRPWWRYLVVGLIAAVIAAGSLSNYVALAAGLVGVCLLAPGPLLGLARKPARRIALGVVVCGALIAGTVALALATNVLPKTIDDFASTRVAGPTVLTRLEMWKMAGAMFVDHPILGVGPGGMQQVSQGYLTERLLELESGSYADYRALMKDPHSLPLLALASLGVVGFAALLWLGIEWLAVLRRLLAGGNGESRSWAFRCALALSVGTSFTAMLFMPWAVSFGPLFPLLAGLAIAGGAEDAARPSRYAPVALKLVGVVAATIVAVWLVGSAVYGESRIAAAKGESSPDLARAAYAAGARVQPTRPYLAYEALYASGFLASDGLESLDAYQAAVDAAPASVTGNAGFAANLVQASLDEAYLTGRTDLTWERGWIERATDAAPNHPDVVLEEAHLALLSGDIDVATRVLARTARIAPGAPRHQLYSYYLALASGDEAAAAELLPRIEATGPGHSRVAKGWDR